MIVDVHADDPEFGYRFIADELEAAGQRSCERRVWRLCREQRIWSTTTKKGRRAHGKTPGPAVHDDLVRRELLAPAPDVVWLTDITEHPTLEGKLYVCSIKDCARTGSSVTRSTADDRPARSERVAVRDRTSSTRGHGRGSLRPRRPVPISSVPATLKANGLTGSMGRVAAAGRQRRDGIVLRAVAEERPEPSSALADPRRAALRESWSLPSPHDDTIWQHDQP